MDPTQTLDLRTPTRSSRAPEPVPTFVILWSVDEPDRVGECAAIPRGQSALGRQEPAPGDAYVRLTFGRHRPNRVDLTGALQSPLVSREQLRISFDGGAKVQIENVGRAPLVVRGREVQGTELEDGDLCEVSERLLLGVVWRPVPLPPAQDLRPHPFGAADAVGMVGESAEAWALRERVAFVAPRPAHVLIQGQSGTGKELVARAIHLQSPRRRGPLISRNSATIPESLVDAELFGHAKDYPNAGSPARAGLVGEADGGTLLLDEFGELPTPMQARLLRVLDEGEFTRLGEGRPRKADLRLVAATNRGDEALKHDVLARFKLRVEVPGLERRREDVPLLARALLRGIARSDSAIARRFFEEGDPERTPRLSLGLTRFLVEYPYETHVRELESLLWLSLQQSRGQWLEAPDAPAKQRPKGAPQVEGVDPNSLDPAVVQACLDRHGGQQEPAWRELGLSSRHVLTRLVKKHGLVVRGRI